MSLFVSVAVVLCLLLSLLSETVQGLVSTSKICGLSAARRRDEITPPFVRSHATPPIALYSASDSTWADQTVKDERTVEENAVEGLKRLARGQDAKYTVPTKDLLEVQGYIIDLEKSRKKPVNASIEGEWDLMYTNEDPTRSSPFFSAFRKNFRGYKTPFRFFNRLPTELSEAIFAITDSIPIKSVGSVKQYISEDEIKSEVRVIVQVAGSSLMTTTSSYKPEKYDTGSNLYEVTVRKTEVLDSTVAKFLPFMDPSSNPNGFPTLGALEVTNPGSSTVYMRTTYNDGDIRISRYAETPDGVFVYKRVA